MEDRSEILFSLGRVCSYRADFEKTQEAVRLIERAFEGYQAQLEELQTVEQRALFALEVVTDMVRVSQIRADDCTEQHAELACENLDMFDMLGDWLAFARDRVPKAAGDQATGD